MRFSLLLIFLVCLFTVGLTEDYGGGITEELPADFKKCEPSTCSGDEVCVLRSPNTNPTPTCVSRDPDGIICSDLKCQEGELCEYMEKDCHTAPCYPVPECQGPPKRFSIDPRKPSRVIKEQSLTRVLRQGMFDCEMSGNCGSGSLEELETPPTPVGQDIQTCAQANLDCGPTQHCMDSDTGATCAPNEESAQIMKNPSFINWCSMVHCAGKCTNTKNGPHCDLTKKETTEAPDITDSEIINEQ